MDVVVKYNNSCTYKHELLVDIVRTAFLLVLPRFCPALAFVNFDVIVPLIKSFYNIAKEM